VSDREMIFVSPVRFSCFINFSTLKRKILIIINFGDAQKR